MPSTQLQRFAAKRENLTITHRASETSRFRHYEGRLKYSVVGDDLISLDFTIAVVCKLGPDLGTEDSKSDRC